MNNTRVQREVLQDYNTENKSIKSQATFGDDSSWGPVMMLALAIMKKPNKVKI